MQVELTAEDHQTVTALLESGRYESVSHIIHLGLQQLREEEANAARIRAALQQAIDSTSRGEIVHGDDFLNELAERRLKHA